MKWLCLALFITILTADDDFITKDEYAEQLYNNPRGISCAACHGADGSGKKIASYSVKNESHIFEAPAINTLPFETFKKALNSRNRGMPRYFLTDNEMKVLYYYLQQRQKKK